METIDTDYGTIGELEKFRRLIFSNTKTVTSLHQLTYHLI